MGKLAVVGGLVVGLVITNLVASRTANATGVGYPGEFYDNSSKDSIDCRCAFPVKGEAPFHPNNNQVKVAINNVSKYYPEMNPNSLVKAIGVNYSDLLNNPGKMFTIKEGYNTNGFAFRLLEEELRSMYNCDCPWDQLRRYVEIPVEKKDTKAKKVSSWIHSEPVYKIDTVRVPIVRDEGM